MYRDTFLFKQTHKAISITNDILPAMYPRQGKFACIQSISGVDVTSATTQINIGVVRGADFIPIQSFLATPAGFVVNHGTELWTYFDDQPALQVIGATLGDEIELIIAGYVLYGDNEG